jgi:DNA polymerase-3 subunit epsilon
MRNVLILDTETTGIDPAKDHVIEVGAILYSIEHATVLEAFSSLICAESNEAEAINRIPAAALRSSAQHKAYALKSLLLMADRSDAFVAHRAEFDRSFLSPLAPFFGERPWICSKYDIQWPKQTRPGSSLVPLALEHDLGVAYAHRALTDCDLIARLFTRSRELGSDLDVMLTRAMRPKAEFVALVSYDDRQLAKDAGFQWNGDTRLWTKRCFIDDASALPFKVRPLNNEMVSQ